MWHIQVSSCASFFILSLIIHWLIINRSGAVEQLRVHVRNLSMLGVNGATDSKGRVELYEKGYGKDAAGIAKEAITYGAEWSKLFCFSSIEIDVGPAYRSR